MPPSALPPPSPPPAPATAGTGTTATPMPPPPPPPAPPSSSLPPLAPAKRDAHAQFTYHGRSLEEIAAARGGIRVGTVGSYVAEAVAAGACVCVCVWGWW